MHSQSYRRIIFHRGVTGLSIDACISGDLMQSIRQDIKDPFSKLKKKRNREEKSGSPKLWTNDRTACAAKAESGGGSTREGARRGGRRRERINEEVE